MQIKVLHRVSRYALLEERNEYGNIEAYIVVKNFNEDINDFSREDCLTFAPSNEDDQLIYYLKALDTMLYMAGKIRYSKAELETYHKISYARIEEIANAFKDKLEEDYSKKEISEIANLSDEEILYFGLEQKYKEYEIRVREIREKVITVAVSADTYNPEDEAENIALELFDGDNCDNYFEPTIECTEYIGEYTKEGLECDNYLN